MGMHICRYEREALSGIVQALLITKHMVFIGFSLRDDAFNQIAATVRRALQPAAGSTSSGTTVRAGAPPTRVATGTGGGEAKDITTKGGTTDAAGASATSGDDVARRPTAFGSALTLSDRPFMAELWPELEAVPMGEGLAETPADSARRRRRLEILLDRVSLQTSDTSTHLLDPLVKRRHAG